MLVGHTFASRGHHVEQLWNLVRILYEVSLLFVIFFLSSRLGSYLFRRNQSIWSTGVLWFLWTAGGSREIDDRIVDELRCFHHTSNYFTHFCVDIHKREIIWKHRYLLKSDFLKEPHRSSQSARCRWCTRVETNSFLGFACVLLVFSPMDLHQVCAIWRYRKV